MKQLRRVESWRSLSERLSTIRLVYLIIRLRFSRLCERYAFITPLGVLGLGLSVAHLGTIVVNLDVRVGRDCRLHPGVTIGATRGLAPQIGDEVFIGPGAGVFGGVTVGDRVHIGTGVLVTTNIPDDSILLPPRPLVRTVVRPTRRDELRVGPEN